MPRDSSAKFFLYQTKENSRIPLNAGANFIGRSPLTRIKDRRLSRNHLKIEVPNTPSKSVKLEHIGSNLSMLNGSAIRKGFAGSLKPGASIELLTGKYEYRLVMEENRTSRTAIHHNHWSSGLLKSMKDPNLICYEDEQICIIEDKYPKAKHHFLVLPKSDISSLKKLTTAHISLIRHMIDSAYFQIINKFTANNKEVEFRCGFHAIPSMSQVHMHVISQDFVSPCLKTKRHWNSFNTKYFIEAEDVYQSLSKNGVVSTTSEEDGKSLLMMEVKCHKCQYKPKGMGTQFKQHLEEHLN